MSAAVVRKIAATTTDTEARENNPMAMERLTPIELQAYNSCPDN
jgi:hypothetical protein